MSSRYRRNDIRKVTFRKRPEGSASTDPGRKSSAGWGAASSNALGQKCIYCFQGSARGLVQLEQSVSEVRCIMRGLVNIYFGIYQE